LSVLAIYRLLKIQQTVFAVQIDGAIFSGYSDTEAFRFLNHASQLS